MINHPTVQAHRPAILIVTPPPIDERQRIEADKQKGFGDQLRRSATHTAKYAAACRDVATAYGCPVVDTWTSFAHQAGWKDGDVVVGNRDTEENKAFQSLFTDGTFNYSLSGGSNTKLMGSRAALDLIGIQDCV